MKRALKLFLLDIKESIELIEVYTKNITFDYLKKDQAKQDAIVRRLEIIGEAVKNIPLAFRSKHSEVPWRKVAGFRDKITHAYFGINIERIWIVIEKELPLLKKQVQKILSEIGDD